MCNDPTDSRVLELKLKGYCCSQIILALVLEDLGRENEDLVNAAAAFCNGLEEGELCGTLAGGVMALYMVDPKAANSELRSELMDWFYSRYGSYKCDDIVHGDPVKKMEICPVMIEDTYEYVSELLDER